VADNPQPKPSQQTEQTPPPAVSPELLEWLRDAPRDARETEETLSAEAGPKEDFPLETAGFEPYEFQ
jgi:hypothetical protein